MTESPLPPERTRPPRRAQAGRRLGLAVVAALLVATALAVALIVRGGDEESGRPLAEVTATSETGEERPPELVEALGLEQLAAGLDTPVYWAGERADVRYEVRRLQDGSVYVRYLPTGTPAGDADERLTVATYPRPAAFAEIQRAAREQGATTFPVGAGGLAVVRASTPNSVNFALPTIGAQVEVFSPESGEARRLVETGAIVPLGEATAVVAPPFLATRAELRAFARRVGGRTYWAGPRSGKELEVTRTSEGAVFVRYLPAGTSAGAPIDALTIATYPNRGGVKALRAAAGRGTVTSVEIPNGLAVYDSKTPTNVHLAFDGGDEQIEVYARTGVDVPALVRNGGIVEVAAG